MPAPSSRYHSTKYNPWERLCDLLLTHLSITPSSVHSPISAYRSLASLLLLFLCLSALMSSITDRLGAIVRNPTTVTVTTAAIAAFVAAALAAGGVQPLLVQFGILRGRGGNGSQRKASREERLLRHVFQRAAEGNPSSVLAVMDDFGWKTEFHMSVGDTKGVFLRNEVANRNPKVAVEIGQPSQQTDHRSNCTAS